MVFSWTTFKLQATASVDSTDWWNRIVLQIWKAHHNQKPAIHNCYRLAAYQFGAQKSVTDGPHVSILPFLPGLSIQEKLLHSTAGPDQLPCKGHQHWHEWSGKDHDATTYGMRKELWLSGLLKSINSVPIPPVIPENPADPLILP